MDVEQLLLTAVLEKGDLKQVIENGITRDFFEDEYHGDVFTWIKEFQAEYAKVPDIDTVRAEWPDWKPGVITEPLDYYLDEIREARRYAIVHEGFSEAHKLLKQRETKPAITILADRLQQAALEVSALRDFNLHDDWEEWFEAYMGDPDVSGIPTGFPLIDLAIGGYRPEQLTTIVGPPKAGKSTLLLAMANAAVLNARKPLFISFEMSAEEQRERYYAMAAQVDYEALRFKRLGRDDTRKLRTALRQREAYRDFVIATDISAGITVGALQAKVAQYQPDVLIVDGVYLMDAEVDAEPMDPKSLTSLTRGLKRLAQRLRLPVVISHQVLESRYSQKRGIRSKDIGYSSSFAQDSDTIIGIERAGEVEGDESRRLSIVLSRNTTPRSALLDWDWSSSTFTEMDVDLLDPDEIADADDA